FVECILRTDELAERAAEIVALEEHHEAIPIGRLLDRPHFLGDPEPLLGRRIVGLAFLLKLLEESPREVGLPSLDGERKEGVLHDSGLLCLWGCALRIA